MSWRYPLAVLFLTLASLQADIDTAYLPTRPSATVPLALDKAGKEKKAVFLILFDDKLTLKTALEFYFDGNGMRDQFEKNFVSAVRDRRRPDVANYDDPSHEWGRARFVVLAPDGTVLSVGRILRNDEAGRTGITEAVKKWERYKLEHPSLAGATPAPGLPPLRR